MHTSVPGDGAVTDAFAAAPGVLMGTSLGDNAQLSWLG